VLWTVGYHCGHMVCIRCISLMYIIVVGSLYRCIDCIAASFARRATLYPPLYIYIYICNPLSTLFCHCHCRWRPSHSFSCTLAPWPSCGAPALTAPPPRRARTARTAGRFRRPRTGGTIGTGTRDMRGRGSAGRGSWADSFRTKILNSPITRSYKHLQINSAAANEKNREENLFIERIVLL
jgi:hypothetical protein